MSPVSTSIPKIQQQKNRNLAGATVNAPGAELANSSHSLRCSGGPSEAGEKELNFCMSDRRRASGNRRPRARTQHLQMDVDGHGGYWLKRDAEKLQRQDAHETVAAGLAVTRCFSSNDIQMHHVIQPSECQSLTQQESWSAMHRSLISIKKLAKREGIITPSVLCLQYNDGRSQVGGTGKCCEKDGQTESRKIAAVEEMAEEFRLHVSCESLSTMAKFERKQSNHVAEVFAVRVTACTPVKEFDPAFYGAENRRGADVFSQRVGFLPWGSLDQCLDVLVAMEASGSHELVDTIDAVSVVSIDKAIELLQIGRDAYKLQAAPVTIQARVKFLTEDRNYGWAMPMGWSCRTMKDVRLTAERLQEAGIPGGLRVGDVLELTITHANTPQPRVAQNGIRRLLGR